MNAYLLPLNAYSTCALDTGTTCVRLTDDYGNQSVLSLRHPFGLELSMRELDQWRDGDMSIREFREATMHGGDYESEFALKIARLVVTAVNELPAIMEENRQLREALAAQQGTRNISPVGRMAFEPLTPMPALAPSFVRPQVVDIPNQEEALAKEIGGHWGLFSVRTARCLKEMGIHMVRDLVEKTAAELVAHTQFGQKCLDEVRAELHHHGLKLKDDPDQHVAAKRKPKKK